MSQPDLILLVLDTQRADRLSCYGYASPTSPYLDAFAENATVFRYAISPAQWTVPAHASLFTGLYPSQHTVHQTDLVLPSSVQTLAERLVEHGYATAGFSQNPLVGLVANRLTRGFQHFENFHLLSNILLTTRLYRPDLPRFGPARIKQALRLVLAESLGYSQQTFLHHMAPVLRPLWKSFLRLRGGSKVTNTQRLLASARNLLVERPGLRASQPLFLFINLMGTHVPYAPAVWAMEQFVKPVCNDVDWDNLLQWANQLQIDVSNWLAAPLSDDKQAWLNAVYDAEVATQDRQVGLFLEQLEAAGRLDNTVVAIVADHGDHLGDKERVNHAFGVYNALVHVPLIVRDPVGTLQAGTAVNSVTSTVRLFHTFLTRASAATDEERAFVLTNSGARPAVDTPIFSEGYPLEWALRRMSPHTARVVERTGHDNPVRAVYADRYKLIATDQREELYDIIADLSEKQDLRQRLPEVGNGLSKRLEMFVRESKPLAAAQVREEALDPRVREQLRDLGYLD